jgi:hypothetical protein
MVMANDEDSDFLANDAEQEVIRNRRNSLSAQGKIAGQ